MRTRAASYVVLSSLLWTLPGLAQAQALAGGEQRSFTTDADFALGTFSGTRAGAPDADQLRIDTGASVPPFLWVASSTTATVTKVDTRTGRQVARFDSVLTHNWDNSVPAVQPPGGECNYPVPTAVDARGNAYVVNSGNCPGALAAITKYAGTPAECVDRNGNGQLDTSSDINGDGDFNDAGEFPGQADECILWTKTYGDVGDAGRTLVVDADQNVWAAGFSSSKLFRLDGQTGAVLAVIDLKTETGASSGIQSLAIGPGGYLYTSDNTSLRFIRKINPNGPAGGHVVDTLTSPVPTFGIIVDRNGVVWLGADSDSTTGVVRADFTAHTAQLVGGGGGCSGRTHGISMDATGDIWAVCQGTNRLLRVSSTGAFKNTWLVGTRPEGVAVAADGKIWSVVSSDAKVASVNPAVGTTVQSFAVGGQPLTYGDMTGYQHQRFISRQGSWSAVHDSGVAGMSWGTVSWNQEAQGATPTDTSITVAVRAANTAVALASQAFFPVGNNQPIPGIQGRFIEVRATLRSVNFGGDPVLSDLTIIPGNHAPVAQCQDQDVCAGPACTAQVSVNNGSSDPDGDALSLAQSPAGPYAIGTSAVDLTVSDGFLSASCSGSVRVRDCEPPTITCGPSVQAECTGGQASTLSAGGADAQDSCSTVSVSGPGLASYPLGSTSVTYTATDAAGNTAACTTLVQVQDSLAPSITCPAPFTAECVGGGASNSGVGPASATDVCSPVVVQSPGLASFPLGTAALTWSAADTSGNTASCSAPFTVADTQAPNLALNGPAALTLDCSETFVDPGATAIDTCQGNVSSQVTISGAVNSTQAGAYVLTYGATDPSGNAATPVTRTVTVAAPHGPTLSLNGANPLPLECMRDWYSELGATAVDGCSGSISGSISIEHAYIDSASPGSYLVTYRVADSGGNVATAVREVLVQDTLAPELYLNGATSLSLECNVNTYVEQGAVATDLCSGNLSGSVAITGTVDTSAPGAYPVSYHVQDSRGLEAEKLRDVHVVDTRPPTLTLEGSSAPVMECSRDGLVPMGATAADLCAGDISSRITVSGEQPIIAPGIYPITYNVTDPSGNAAQSVTRNVTIRDTKGPVVTITGEANMVLECGVDSYTELGATAYDACQGDMTSQVHTYGNGANTAAVGTYSIQYGVWDASGNTTQALRTVKVVDRLPPTLSMVGPATVQHECASGPYQDSPATATDACYGDLSLSVTTAGSVSAWTRGSYTLTYNVQDSTLLKATPLTRTVQVTDTQAPTLEYRDVSVSPADQTLRSFSLADCATANDTCDGYALANNGTILSIYSDEPEDAPGDSDGSTVEDIVITGKSTFKLRAERQGGGDGRVYGVAFELKDQTGNTRAGLCRIRIPLTEAGTANDSGAGAGYTVMAP